MGEADDQTSSALTRRNAIKAAAAVGVGAAAWTGPKIGVFGASPAYAGVCSPGELSCAETGQLSTQPNCGAGTGQNASFSFSLPTLNLNVDGNAVTATASDAPNSCTDGQTNILISNASLTCQVRVRFFEQGGGNAVLFDQTFSGSASIAIPNIIRSTVQSSSVFLVIGVCCSSDPADCFN